jgi:hypothetical protein
MTVPEATRATRLVAWLALAGVSLIAGVVSYIHGHTVCLALGTGWLVAWLTPFLADLVILGESAALVDASRRHLRLPRWDILALVVAVGMTLAMNVAAADPHILPAWLVDAWPPVAFGLALHCIAGLVRRGRGGEAPARAPATPDACPHGVPETAEEAVRIAFEHGRDCLGKAPAYRQLATRFGIDRNKVPRLVAPKDAPPAGNPPPPGVPASAAVAAALPAPGASGVPPRPLAHANGSHGG